jgi:hypothetical protein
MPRVSSRNPEKDPAAFLGEHLRPVRVAVGYRIRIERRTNFLRSWSPMLMPGPQQVDDHAVTLFYAIGKTKEKATELLARRLGRREILSRPDPVTGVFLNDESVLHRLVGSAEVMVRQLDRVLAASERFELIRGRLDPDRVHLGRQAVG